MRFGFGFQSYVIQSISSAAELEQEAAERTEIPSDSRLGVRCWRRLKRRRDDTVVPLEQVPNAALKAARARLPDIKFDQAWKLPGRDAYELRGKTNTGKIREVEVTSSGRILEVN